MPKYLTQATLKRRGWTAGLIARFLPEPDLTDINPHNPSWADVKLYDAIKVGRVEATQEFSQALAQADKTWAAKRSSGAGKPKPLNAPAIPPIEPPVVFPREELIQRACAYYNAWKANQARKAGNSKPRLLTPESDWSFLRRICFNYIRYELMPTAKHFRAQIGDCEATQRFEEQVHAVINNSYPWLETDDDCSSGCEMKLGSDGDVGFVMAAPDWC